MVFHFETLIREIYKSAYLQNTRTHRNGASKTPRHFEPMNGIPVRQRLSFTFFTNATRPSCGAVAPGMGIAPLPPASGQLRQLKAWLSSRQRILKDYPDVYKLAP